MLGQVDLEVLVDFLRKFLLVDGFFEDLHLLG